MNWGRSPFAAASAYRRIYAACAPEWAVLRDGSAILEGQEGSPRDASVLRAVHRVAPGDNGGTYQMHISLESMSK